MKKKLRSGNKSIYSIVQLLLFFTFHTTSFSQVKFSAVCLNRQIGRNEYLRVQYNVENASDVQQIVPPAFKNFVVVSGPNQQSSTSIINGAVSQSVGLEFILKPNGTGTFTLPPATALVNGKKMVSNSLAVVVTNTSSGNPGGAPVSPFSSIITDAFPAPSTHQYDDYILHKGENVSTKIKKNLFVKLDVSKTSCYVGEPIVATYKLYTRLKSESNLIKTPSFNGFSVSEMKLPESYSTAIEKYNGREYNVYILRKVQLYPLQPGEVELGPVEVDNHITFIKAEYANSKNGDIFYDMIRDFVDTSTPAEGMEDQRVTLQSKPLNIVVKPLPVLNQPKDFKGAAGSFSIKAGVDKTSITTDETGNLAISISGNGNIAMINAPPVDWPRAIEVFDLKTVENIDKTMIPFDGQKIFNYPFTCSAPGKYVIPVIHFSYFDISTQSYKTIVTSPVTFDVKKGKSIWPALSNPLGTPGKNGPPGSHLAWFWIVSCSAVAIALVLIWLAGKPQRKSPLAKLTAVPAKTGHIEADPTVAREVAIPQNPLSEAEKMLLEDNNNFYHALNNGLKSYLSVKLSFPEKELTKRKINELLDTHNVSVGTTFMLSSLLENIELNVYAPMSSAYQKQKIYENASEVVALLDKQII